MNIYINDLTSLKFIFHLFISRRGLPVLKGRNSFAAKLLKIKIRIAAPSTYSHEHSDEPASFKYSQEANVEQEHHHGHDHGHDHDHGHGHAHDHDHGHGHAHDHDHGHDDTHHQAKTPKEATQSQKSTGLMLWLQACGATAVISVSPGAILLFIPLENAHEHQSLLKIPSYPSQALMVDGYENEHDPP
jgi:hypothetical protein